MSCSRNQQVHIEIRVSEYILMPKLYPKSKIKSSPENCCDHFIITCIVTTDLSSFLNLCYLFIFIPNIEEDVLVLLILIFVFIWFRRLHPAHLQCMYHLSYLQQQKTLSTQTLISIHVPSVLPTTTENSHHSNIDIYTCTICPTYNNRKLSALKH